LDLCAGYAHAKVLSCLVHIGRSDVAPDNAVGIRRNLSAYYARPAFENNNLVELFSFRLVHIHDDNAAFGPSCRCEMLHHKCLPRYGKCVTVGTVLALFCG
jgi:hypothetical protein